MAQTNIRAVITAEDRASGVLKKFGLSGVLTMAALTQASKLSFQAFEQQELATTRLAAGIKNVKSASDHNIDSLLEQAAALQKVTRFSDEAVISAQGILSTFQLNQKQIETLTPSLIDMSEGLARVDGTLPDLEGNAMLVAKALGGEDVTGLVGALRRVGIIMTNTQIEIMKTGDMETRVSTLTEILGQNFKGMGEAAGTTTAGKVAILQNQFGELQEKIGQVMSEALMPIMDFLMKHPGTIEAMTYAVIGLATAFVTLKTAALISEIMAGAKAAIIGVGSAASFATTQVSALSATSLAAWAGGIVGAAGIVAPAITSIFNAFSGAKNITADLEGKANQLASSLRKQGKNKEADELMRRFQEVKSSVPSFAGGVTNFEGGLAYVHEGEVLANLPKGSNVIPKNDVGGLGNTFNISVNVGVYSGSDIEMRKLSQTILKSLKDVASSQGKSLPQLIGAN